MASCVQLLASMKEHLLLHSIRFYAYMSTDTLVWAMLV